MLSVLAQPCAISGGDKGAKTLQAWIIRGARLKVGKNLAQSKARHGPIIRALLQHEPRVADRPTNDFVNKSVHRGGPLLSIGDNLDEAVANAAPLT